MTIELVLPTFNYATSLDVVVIVVIVVVVAIRFSIVIVCMCDRGACFVHLQLWTK